MKDELSLLQAQLTYKKRLEAMLKELRGQRDSLCKKVSELETVMKDERSDVDRLEGHSLAAFFYNVVGKKDEKLDEERREYYAARVKYDAARRELEAIEQDIESTEEDLQDLADCEARYARKLEEKRLAIEAAGTRASEELLGKERTKQFLQSQERDFCEAIDAGTAALRTIADVLQSIESAKDWAAFDLLGGGFLADMAKHDKLDEAQKSVEQLQIDLQHFNKELSDVSVRADLQVNIEGLLKFADYFFDSLLTDAAVLDRIRQSYSQVEQTQEQLLDILRQLHTKLEDVRHKSAKLQKEIDALIVSIEL